MRLKRTLLMFLTIILLISTIGCGITDNIAPSSVQTPEEDLPQEQAADDCLDNPWTASDPETIPEEEITWNNKTTDDDTDISDTPHISNPGVTLVTGVSLNALDLKLGVNQTAQLQASISPVNATQQGVEWSSSDPAIAIVDPSGVVKTQGNGTATITVSTNCGSKTAVAQVIVITPVTGISLNASSINILENRTNQVLATISPANASNKGTTWTSSNPGIASVNSSGRITAKASGEAIITVKTNDGGKAAVMTVSVTAPAKDATSDERLLLGLVNQEREKAGLPPLKLDLELTTVARFKSQDMIENNYFAHSSPTYGSPFDMMKYFGLSFTAAGENLAMHPSVESSHQGLMNSDKHRKIIMSDKYTYIGIGILKCAKGRYYVTQLFMR